MITKSKGRPPAPADAKKEKQFGIRTTEAEHERLERAAQIDRRTLAEFVRLAALDKADEVIRNHELKQKESADS
ncbi:MAG: DUF1778 domain-containing protein [Planctomycetota bacterium]|nr:DUF1778 domain-containing protein [Planctomycetota bacterium]